MLNANFFVDDTEVDSKIGGAERSIITKLKKTISSWYKTLRLISIVGLLSVLVYIGIRIIISSTAGDKAKYKERLKDWLVAICLVFFLHYIMVFIMTAVDSITATLSNSAGTTNGMAEQINIEILNDGETDKVKGQDVKFATNLTGYIRLCVEAKDLGDKLVALIMYLGLTAYTIYFVFIYLKRLLTLIFLTLIAPLVSLTYPLDKLKDGKAQAFNYWLREYTINAMLPIIHLILYTILVTSATDLVREVPLYAIVALAFIVPAEKIVKEMFGFKSQTAPGGGFAGGVMASQAINALAKRGSSGGKNESGNSGSGSTKNKIPTYGNRGQINSSASDLAKGDNLSENSERTQNQAGRTGSSGVGTTPGTGTNDSQNLNLSAGDPRLLDNAMANTMLGDWDDEPSTPGTGTNDSQNPNLSAGDPRLLDNAMANTMLGDWDEDESSESHTPISHDNDTNTTTETDGAATGEEPIDRGNYGAESAHQFRTDLAASEAAEKAAKKEKRREIRNNALNMAKRRFNATSGAGLAGKMALAAGKKVGRAYIRTAGVVGGASIGLAAGMVSGDLNDMWKGLSLGAVGGNMIGKNTANRIENVGSKVNKARDFKNELLHGEDYAARTARERDFIKNPENIKYMKEKHKIGSEGYEDLTQAQYDKKIKEDLKAMSAYEKTTGGDIKKMDKLYKLEQDTMNKRGLNKEQSQKYAEQISELAKKYQSVDLDDQTKYNNKLAAQEKSLQKQGLNSKQAKVRAKEIMEQVKEYNA